MWPGLAGIFPPMVSGWFEDAVADLCYTHHGGSGFGFTRADVLAMDYDEIAYYRTWLQRRRQYEASAIKRSTKRPGKG